MNTPQHYCPYPFSQITTTPTGQFKLCCSSSEAHGFVSDFPGSFETHIKHSSIKKFWNSEYLRWVRDNHLKNKPIKECEACFSYEKCGNQSYRQRALKELGYYERELDLPRSLDLKLGNKCNASCLFCDPSSSSRVLKEWRDIGWDKNPPFDSGLTGWVTPELFKVDYDWAERPEFWAELLELAPHLTNLKFTGGEPLINRYMIKYLEHLIEQGHSKKMRLQVTTNGITVPRQFIEFLPFFREVQINFSVDGYRKQNEYIRFPTRWESWLRNVENVSDNAGEHVQLYFQHSISVYSVFGLQDYFRWMWPYKKFGFHLFKVFHPEIQRTELLEHHEKVEVIQELSQLVKELSSKIETTRDQVLLNEITGIKNFLTHQEDKSHLKPKLREFIRKLDAHRKISMADYMPRAARSLGLA